MPVPIKLSVWNIHGYKSKIIGNKLNDLEFLKEIDNDDVVALVETHNHSQAEDDLSIPGFRRIENKNRSHDKKSFKCSGGMAVFAREAILKYIIPIKNTNENSLWLKVKKEALGGKKDIFIGTIYLTPRKSNGDSSKKIYELFEEILYFQDKGQIILQGDFNARTNVDNDNIPPDKFDEFHIPNVNIPHRNSEDKIPSDYRGKELLELCKALGLVILNGRKTGDIFGKYTSFQWNGNSVVDYVIVSQPVYDEIECFKVGNYIPWLSDHCAIRYKLNTSNDKLLPNNKNELDEEYESIRWDKNSNNKFIDSLRKCKDEIHDLLHTPSSDAKTINDIFKNIVYKTTELGNFKKTKTKNNTDPLWFDKECKKSKDEIRQKGRTLQKNPDNPILRKSLNECKRSFKKLTKNKKSRHIQKVLDEMYRNKNSNEGKKFWNSLNKLDNKKMTNNCISSISQDSWIEHFESIRCGENEPTYPPDCNEDGPLDFEISEQELLGATSILKNGKSSGSDMISYEMLKCVIEFKPSILLKVFNSALQYNPEILDWFISIISPIHKKGSRMDPNNYRGISLISCVYKLFTVIIKNRCEKHCKENKILSEKQLGFVSGNRTSDAHLILHNLIRKYCHKKGKYLYSCLVDFSKAFDSIPRDLLFQKLLSKGIKGKIFNLLKNIYSHEKCKIKIGKYLSKEINVNQGVRQGCILSPLLFNIFISDLASHLGKPEHNAPNLCDFKDLGCILWADDLVVLSKDEEGLCKMINDLGIYAADNGLKINEDKTKVMIFNKTGRLMRRNFQCNNLSIHSVREYKYLGFMITPSGEILTGLKDLKSRATYALVQLRRKLGENFRKYPNVTLHLFDALIKPILIYMSDFWGCLKMPKHNPIDMIYNKFLKQLLGVQIQTSNIGVLLEIGRVPISLYAQRNCIKNWDRIVQKSCNSLTEMAYNNMVKEDILWYRCIKSHLAQNGLQYIMYRGSTNQLPHNVFFKRITDIFYQNSFAEINRENSKLRTYKLLKTTIGQEPYITEIQNVNHRIAFSKFRLSNHSLMIEKGRHLKMNKESRLCQFCPRSIEDEIHFLIGCKTYYTPSVGKN